MVPGSMLLTCLTLLCGADGSDSVPNGIAFNRREFQIPVRLSGDLSQLRGLIIWKSTDEGKTWQPAGPEFSPEQKKFDFKADADGVYYFSISSVDRNGRSIPDDPSQLKVMQRVLVKTLPPKVQITAVERGDQGITVKWDSKDKFAERETFKLFYQPVGGSTWTEVTNIDMASGQATFRAEGDVGRVRIEVLDSANNRGDDDHLVSAPVPVIPASRVDTPPPSPTPGPSPPNTLPIVPPGGLEVRPMDMSHAQGWNYPQPQMVPAHFEGTPTRIAVSGVAGPAAPGNASGSPPEARVPHAQLPPVKYVNSKRITIKYKVDQIGSSGIGGVALYLTRDDGRSWVPYTGETNLIVPAPADPRTSMPLQQSLTFDLPGEGLYGVYVIVKNGVNIGMQPPNPGQAPQVRFLVDVTPPQVVLMAPFPEKDRHDTVIISWQAVEANPTPTPILLEWAEQETSEWHQIGPGEMPNSGVLAAGTTGSYSWKVPAGTPGRIYLRLTMRDLAGNVAVAQTSESQIIDLKAPNIIDVQVEPVLVPQN